jgi:hypothetical protein
MLRSKRALLYLVICLLAYSNLPAQSESRSLFSLSVNPAVSIPLGEDSSLYSFGGGASLQGEMKFPFLSLLSVRGELGYNFVPLKVTTSLSLLSIGVGAGIGFNILPALSLGVYGGGGYFYGLLNDGSGRGGGNPYLSAGGGIAWLILPAFGIELGAEYRLFWGLYNDVAVNIGASLHLGAAAPAPALKKKAPPEKLQPLKKGSGLMVTRFALEDIFPVFYGYYSDHPLGKAVLKNWESSPAEDLTVSLYVKEYMVNPKTVKIPGTIDAGAEREIDLYGLFTSKLLEVSEGTVVSANISLEYAIAGKAAKQEYVQEMRILNSHALTWDDDRKAAAFVSAKDPTVMKLARNVVTAVKGATGGVVNQNLALAMGIHEILTLYGITYVQDPTSPYQEASKNKRAVDFLQFPQQTLDFKTGDCDDLSVLYCALLESVGVETAFITIPGHIYMAISLDMKPDGARKTFLKPDELILWGDTSWVPIEVTQRTGGFLKAWEMGAKEWRENEARQQASLYPTREAWKQFAPVGFASMALPIVLPPEERLAKAFGDEVTRFVNREISAREAKLQGDLKKDPKNSKTANQLGILYAQYGLYDRAEAEFKKILDREAYVPALLNTGSLFSVRGDAKKALEYYNQAYQKAPGNPRVLLAVARANHGLENYGLVRDLYDKLKDVDPQLAQQYAYLDLRGEESKRAANEAQRTGVVVWEE